MKKAFYLIAAEWTIKTVYFLILITFLVCLNNEVSSKELDVDKSIFQHLNINQKIGLTKHEDSVTLIAYPDNMSIGSPFVVKEKMDTCITLADPIGKLIVVPVTSVILQSEPQFVMCERHEAFEELVKAIKKIGIHVYKDPTNKSTTPSFIVSVNKMTPSELKKFVKS